MIRTSPLLLDDILNQPLNEPRNAFDFSSLEVGEAEAWVACLDLRHPNQSDPVSSRQKRNNQPESRHAAATLRNF